MEAETRCISQLNEDHLINNKCNNAVSPQVIERERGNAAHSSFLFSFLSYVLSHSWKFLWEISFRDFLKEIIHINSKNYMVDTFNLINPQNSKLTKISSYTVCYMTVVECNVCHTYVPGSSSTSSSFLNI